jgi:hypothetical protein
VDLTEKMLVAELARYYKTLDFSNKIQVDRHFTKAYPSLWPKAKKELIKQGKYAEDRTVDW